MATKKTEHRTEFYFPSGTAIVGPSFDDIDRRSEDLIEEFAKHVAEVHESLRARNPAALEPDGGIDRRKVFEGWAFQKLASMQLYVELYEKTLLQLLAELGR